MVRAVAGRQLLLLLAVARAVDPVSSRRSRSHEVVYGA